MGSYLLILFVGLERLRRMCGGWELLGRIEQEDLIIEEDSFRHL